MNAKYTMIIIKGEIKTPQIKSCQYNRNTKKWDVVFNDNKRYSYHYTNVKKLRDPFILNPEIYHLSKDGRELLNISEIYVFKDRHRGYFHVCFKDGSIADYHQKELEIDESCFNQTEAANVFTYLKQIANLNEIKNPETNEKLLIKRYEQITFISKKVALAKYLNPKLLKSATNKEYTPIFPFGCNNSQYQAVKNAMENQISVIQGPPGTGKTQTILNIIANILMEGKTVQIVSNNNSATQNIYEKLASSKYNLGFIIASLGNSENKKIFIENQDENYPDFSSWKTKEDLAILKQKVAKQSLELKTVFDKKEKLAYLKQELSQLSTELTYFNQYIEESDVDINNINIKKNLTSTKWLQLWQETQNILEQKKKIGFFFKIKNYLKYRIKNNSFYNQDISKIITTFQAKFYKTRKQELITEIEELENYLNTIDKNLLSKFCDNSMKMLKDKLAVKYNANNKRKIFSERSLWNKANEFLKEYPVILSTTFSSKTTLNPDVIYDYLIMDEASQVDIVTGALALSCAKNVVIVGDSKQLPNIVNNETKNKANNIFNSFKIDKGYQYTNSFLQSILDVLPDVKQTLLKEHYRCHPKIIEFCNQKFYQGQLIIMTDDKGEDGVLTAIKTAKGNHERNHYSQRQIDVIKNEIMPRFAFDAKQTGIITPYKNQVNALKKEFSDFDIATVHKFQGREKDNIIISTVDDEISDFADDPYLINVAISRAKKRLVLVVTGNNQNKDRNILDLMDYIRYNNFEVSDSKIYSVFDYLYKQYRDERKRYLQKHQKVSDYDSENLMYAIIEEIRKENKYSNFDVLCHVPLNMLIKDPQFLNEQECRYVMNPATHLDFLIYNSISKKPLFAIEVDGYDNHKEGTKQAFRDLMKDHILELYHIPLLRFKTNGSMEKDRIKEMLNKIYNS